MPKSTISRRPRDLDDAINRGGTAAANEDELDDERLHTVNIRLPMRVWKQIDARRKKQPGTVSRNTWIAQAIEDKLEGEGKTATG